MLKDESHNDGVKAFLGEADGSHDLIKYESWYSTDVLNYLTHLLPAHPDVYRYIFTHDPSNVELSFYKQWVALCHLSRELEKAIHFIATESPIAQNHFIFGVITGEEMLVVNPIGITQHRDFKSWLEKIKQDGKLSRVYESTVVLQKDAAGLVSCGPICIELMHSISALPLKTLLKQFDVWRSASSSGVDIRELLSSFALLHLLSALEEAAYQKAIIGLRAQHLEFLKQCQGESSIAAQNSKLEGCLGCREQGLVFEMPSKDAYYKVPDNLKADEKYGALWLKKRYLKAIGAGDLEEVTRCLAADSLLLNALNLKGFTPLMLAILANHEEIVRELLSQEVSVDGGNTVYEDATSYVNYCGGRQEILKMLLGVSTQQTSRVGAAAAAASAAGGFYQLSRSPLSHSDIQPPDVRNSSLEVDVPHDNSCLFWAVVLAYLIPVVSDNAVFQERFIKVFGDREAAHLEYIKELMHSYNPFGACALLTDRESNRLVREEFRRRVVEHMEAHQNDFKSYWVDQGNRHEKDFGEYLSRMHAPNSWGGDLEIRAMSELLGCSIEVIGAGFRQRYLEDRPSSITLMHVSAGQDHTQTRNHYHFRLEQELGDTYRHGRLRITPYREEGRDNGTETPRIYITGHRGMGVTSKRRDLFIKNATFYPENSIAAFREAIRTGADALECDIHVSKDNVPMVIHGNKITDYAYFLGPGSKQFESDENKTCNFFTAEQIQRMFALKTFEGVEPKSASWEESGKESTIERYLQNLRRNPELYQIPKLDQLLRLVFDENKTRKESGVTPLMLNIELKGVNSGFLTLDTIQDFNKKTPIDLTSIVLLGKASVGEIIVAKNLLKHAPRHSLLPPNDKKRILFGRKELERYFTYQDWKIFLVNCDSQSFSEFVKAHEKSSKKYVYLTNDFNFFISKSGKFYKQGSNEKKAIELNSLNLEEADKKLIQQWFYKGIGNIEEKQENLPSGLLYTIFEQVDFPDSSSDVPQNYREGQLFRTITNYCAKDDRKKDPESCFIDFLDKISKLSLIRTNVMLSTGDLYGQDSLLSHSEDFDLKPNIRRLPNSGCELIIKLFYEGYDGIDISLFDFDEYTCRAISKGILEGKTTAPIIGTTASNWKGVKSEKSPVSPATALMRVQLILVKINVGILLKVDEPGNFKFIYQKILQLGPLEESKDEKIIARSESGTKVTTSEIICSNNFEKLSPELSMWLSGNLDTRPAQRDNLLFPILKPPRGSEKKLNREDDQEVPPLLLSSASVRTVAPSAVTPESILSEEMTQTEAFELQKKLIEAGIKLDLITIISKMDNAALLQIKVSSGDPNDIEIARMVIENNTRKRFH